MNRDTPRFRSARFRALAAGLVGALLLLAPACENSGVTLGDGDNILLTVNPSAINIDPTGTIGSRNAQIRVTTFSDGDLVGGVSVFISASGGTLADTILRSDGSGNAVTTLTVTAADAGEITVTAQSSAVVSEDSVLVTVQQGNEPPVALILTTPLDEAQIGEPVLFSGSLSSDPDGVITCYQWEIVSDVPAFNEIVQGPGAAALDRVYSSEQTLLIFLRVSDDPAIGAICDPSDPPIDPNSFNGTPADQAYTITCTNPPPVAEAGEALNVPITSAQTVFLDGSRSTDDRPIEKYLWTCGNGLPALITDASKPWEQLCRYSLAGTYTATLTIWDQGDGTIDPGNGAFGNWNCQKSSSDTTIVTVFNPPPS